MAVTKMWKYESRLDIFVNYVKNGEKTENCWLVSGINCSNDITVNEMRNVKKQFFKTGGIKCFHGIQSFEEGEVTPEVAHLIGIKLARELWGDRFQVLVYCINIIFP